MISVSGFDLSSTSDQGSVRIDGRCSWPIVAVLGLDCG